MASTSPVLVLQHGPLGPPGVFEDWLRARAIPFELHAAWRDPLPPDPADFTAVASLGSEHSAAATDPGWIAQELALLRDAIARDVPVLGLCFGGQALSVALGGEVRPAAAPQVGWKPVETSHPEDVPPGPWLQFHWEVFETPRGADELARTAAGPAAFRHGRHLGTQFHPEATPEIVDAWAHAEPRLPQVGRTPEELLDEGRRHAPVAAVQAHRLFDGWWAAARG
jgi:GMP synthase-like glutamine amidotransferase